MSWQNVVMLLATIPDTSKNDKVDKHLSDEELLAMTY